MTLAPLFRSPGALRKGIGLGSRPLAFVPTMGALHAGHLALVQRARREHRHVAVSIFVNPSQFGPNEDLGRYPRSLAADRALVGRVPGAAVWAPSVDQVYPAGFASTVKVGACLGTEMEAAFRPGHFEGVATVVARLFGLLKPQAAYFGLKDYQQFLVIRRMTRDLGLAVALHGCPTVREPDGLALSSRNRYLSAPERLRATALIRALRAAQREAQQGERSGARLCAAGLKVLRAETGLKVQYFALADAADLRPLARLDRPAVLATACLLGRTRLIDNLILRPSRPSRKRN